MIEKILPAIRDGADYIKALTLFRAQAPADAAELVGIYTKYAQGIENAATAAIYVAVDLLPGRGEDDTEDFTALGLSSADIDAMFRAKVIATGQNALSQADVDSVVATISGNVSEPLKALLARLTLDALVSQDDLGDFSEQVSVLADYLTGLGDEKMDEYTSLVSEVRMKFRV